MTELPGHLRAMSARERADFEDGALRLVFADTFSLLLEDLGISQRELARRLGVAEPAVSRMLSGRQNLRLSTIARIANALGVRVRPHLVPSFRAGTPSLNDGPLPHWVDPVQRPRFGTPQPVLAAQAEWSHSEVSPSTFLREVATQVAEVSP